MEDDTLRNLYGPKVTHTRASTTGCITPHMGRDCLAAVVPLTISYEDGWRTEPQCVASLKDLVFALAAGDVRDDTCDLLSSANFVIFLKKTKSDTEALIFGQGAAYVEPQHPLGMGGGLYLNRRQIASLGPSRPRWETLMGPISSPLTRKADAIWYSGTYKSS